MKRKLISTRIKTSFDPKENWLTLKRKVDPLKGYVASFQGNSDEKKKTSTQRKADIQSRKKWFLRKEIWLPAKGKVVLTRIKSDFHSEKNYFCLMK